jgi:MFS family permease
LADEHNITGLQAGVLMAAYTVSAIFSRLYCGHLLDSYGRKIVYLLALIFFSAVFLFYILAAGWIILLILRIAHGIAWGLVTTAAQTAVTDTMPASRRGEGIGMFGLFTSLAMALGPALGMWVGKSMSYNSLFIFEAAAAFIGFCCAYFATYIIIPKKPVKLRLSSLIECSTLPVGIVTFIFIMSYGAILNWISVYAKQVNDGNVGLFFICMAGGTALTRALSGKVYDQRGPEGISAVGFFFLALSLFLLFAVHHPLAFYAAGAVHGIGIGVIFPVTLAIVNSLVGNNRRGAANSTYYILFDSGFSAGLLLAGALMSFMSLEKVYGVFIGVIILAAALFYLFAWPRSRPGAADVEAAPPPPTKEVVDTD